MTTLILNSLSTVLKPIIGKCWAGPIWVSETWEVRQAVENTRSCTNIKCCFLYFVFWVEKEMKETWLASIEKKTGTNVQFSFSFLLFQSSPFLLTEFPSSCLHFHPQNPLECFSNPTGAQAEIGRDGGLECKDKASMIDWLPTVKCTANNSARLPFYCNFGKHLSFFFMRNEILSWEIVEILHVTFHKN